MMTTRMASAYTRRAHQPWAFGPAVRGSVPLLRPIGPCPGTLRRTMTLSWPSVRRGLLLAAAFAATGAAVAYLVSEADPERYRATVAWSLAEDHVALVLAVDADLGPELDRLARASRSRPVIADALERVDGRTPGAQRVEALVARTEIEVDRGGVPSGDAAVLRLHVTGTTREDAFTHAQALAA